MAIKIEDVKLGVCDVYFDGANLGATKGGVEVSFETNTYQVKLDQTGETPAKDIITGRGIKVKVPMAETNLERMAALIPGAQAILNAANTATVGVKIDIGLNVDMFTVAKELKLHPTGQLISSTAEDFGLFKAAPTASFSFTMQTNQERIYELEFTAYPDAAYGDGLGWFGAKPEKLDIYWGRATGTQINEAGIEGLVSSAVRGTRKGTVSWASEGGANTTLWIAFPKVFATGFNATSSVVNASGLAIPFTAGTEVDVTAADGVTRKYVTYKSSSAVAGAITNATIE